MANIALYEAGTTDFFSQGMGVLSDVISSTSTETASTTGNESSKLELQYPVGGFLANKLTEGRFVRVSRSIDSSDYAIFEITDTLRDDSGVITIYGTPYSDRLGRMSFENGGKFKEYHSVQVALDAAKAQMKGFPSWFQLTSDLSQAVDFTKDQPYENFSKFLEALNKKVGGNVYYGLTNIRIYSKRGKDRTDIVLRDDLNTKAIKVKTDYTKIVNRIIPLLPVKDEKGNDTQETKVGKVVESGYANKFIDYWAGTVIQVKTQDEANTYFNRTKIDRPTQTVTVDPIELDIDLSDVQLFDQISVYSSKLDFTNKLRVSERTIDNLTGEVTAFKLGDTSPSIVASIVQSNQDIFHRIKEIGNSVISANGKTQLFFGSVKPRNPHEGDLWYKEVDGESYMMVYHNGEWVEVISTKFKELLDKQISDVLQSSKEYSDNLNTAIAGEVGKIKSDVNTQLQTAKTERDNLNAKAEAIKQDVNTRLETAALDRKKLSDESKQLAKTATDHADDLFAQANTNAKAEAASALSSANSALSEAKSDLINGIASEASERQQAVRTVNSQAQTYANQAKSDAIAAAKTADGQVRKDFKATTDSLTSTISQNKQDSDGKISTAQSTATQALNGLKTKVSQTDYNTKTGQLQSDLTTTTQTANQAKLDIASIKSEADTQSAKINDIISDANGTKQTISDLKTEQGKQSGSIATLKSRADGFEATVTKVNNLSVGGRNLLIGTNSNTKSSLNPGNGSYTTKYVSFSNGYKYNFSYTTASTNWAVYMFSGFQKDKFAPNTDYVLSFMANVSTDIKPGIYFANGSANHNFVKQVTKPTILSSNGDQKVVIQLRTNSTIPDESDQSLYINGFVNKVGTFSIWDLKIEVGNVPTDWTPAPEDLSGATAKAQLTADKATLAINNYKTDADGRIKRAQADITATANEVKAKVSQSDYNTKTGELDSKVGTAQLTANEAKTELAAYKKTADGNISSNKAAITAANNLIKQKVSQTDYDARTKTVDTKMGQFSIDMNKALTQISDVTARVNDLNQINQLYNTEFSPDLQGWECTSTDGKHNPYPSYLDKNVKAATVGFWTVTAENSGNAYFTRFQQIIPLGNAGNGVLSVSWQSYIPENVNNLYCHLWIKFYDKDGNPVYNSTGGNVMADWAKTGQKTWERQKKENIEIPTGAVKVAVSFETREGIRAYLVRPMLVFDSKIGSYVPGNYNNNARVASVEVALDGITELVKDPKNGLSAVRTLAANGQTVAIAARDKANANAKSITKVTETANGTQTTVSKMTGNVTELTNKQTRTAKQLTDEITDRKTGDSNVETSMKNLISKQITSVTEGYKSLNVQTERSFNTKITTITNQINDMGQVNLIKNSEFNPDLEGWYTNTSGTIREPYRSYWQPDTQATTVGWATQSGSAKSYARLRQDVQLASTPTSGHQISMSWYSYTGQVDNYNNLWLMFYDKDGNVIADTNQYANWADRNGNNPSKQNNWNVQNKWEGIDVPDTATMVKISFEAREGTSAYLAHPMLVMGSTIGSYTPGPYNNNATVESNRLQLVNMIQDKVKDYTNKIEAVRTTTAKQITDEVRDRKNGDSTVTTNLSKMIDQRATSLKSGYESYFNQQSQSIIMGVGTPNQLKNTNFSPDLDGWDISSNKSDNSGTFYRSITDDYGRNAVGVNTTNINGSDTNRHYAYLEQDVRAPGWKDGTVVSVSWHIQVRKMLNYAWLWIQFLDGNKKHMLKDDGSQASYGYNYGATGNNADGRWHDGKFENIRAPKGTVYIRVSFQAREGSNLYLTAPMVTFTSKAAAYVPGPYSHTGEQTVLNLLKEKWSIGIADNAGRIISGINGDRSGLAIIAKKVTISKDTVVQGTSWLNGAVMKDASISRAKIGKLNVSDADVINMNVSKLSGNINHFVVSHVNTLDAKVLYGNTGHLGTTDTGRVINKQDKHLQLASKGFYDSRNDRAQLELLSNASGISNEMKGSLNYYGNPTSKGHGLGIRLKNNQILAIDEDKGSKMLYLSPYQGGEVRVVSRDLKAYYPMRASSFNAMSSRSAKSDIVPFEDCALDIVKKTKIRTYVKSGKQEIGVISDEADPRMLTDDDNAVSLYDYTSILYKAVQELSQQVEELKNGKSTNES